LSKTPANLFVLVFVGNFERAHENLQDSVIDAGLSVSQIAADFEVKMQTDQEILRWVRFDGYR